MTETEKRIELNSIFEDILGSKNVYFQPPENLKLKFPCIIYDWSANERLFADNSKYRKMRRYSVTVVDKNPDSEIPDRLEALDFCSFDRRYCADNIYHTVYTLYY